MRSLGLIQVQTQLRAVIPELCPNMINKFGGGDRNGQEDFQTRKSKRQDKA